MSSLLIVSLSANLLLSLFPFFSFSLSLVSLWHLLSLSPSLSLFFISVFIYPAVSLPNSFALSLSLTLSIYLSPFLYFSLFLSIYLSHFLFSVSFFYIVGDYPASQFPSAKTKQEKVGNLFWGPRTWAGVLSFVEFLHLNVAGKNRKDLDVIEKIVRDLEISHIDKIRFNFNTTIDRGEFNGATPEKKEGERSMIISLQHNQPCWMIFRTSL